MLDAMVSAGRKRIGKRPEQRGELSLIEQIRQRATGVTGTSVRLAIGDDCAILRPRSGDEIVVTTDLSLENRHFSRSLHPPVSIGHRTLARGLSDIASMGAKPVAAFLSLALPRSVASDPRWLDGFLDGFLGLAAEYGAPLAGGDTSEAPGDGVLADIVLLGSAPAGRALRRSGARPGDVLYCTGALGGAATEFAALSAQPRKFRKADPADPHPHLFPRPRVAVGQTLLRRHLASACIDTSDGISTDLAHLCEASGVGAELDLAALPFHPLTRELDPASRLRAALHGGEDYELLFTAAASARMPKSISGVAISAIGSIVRHSGRGDRVVQVEADGRGSPLRAQGWEHFSR